MRSIPFPALPRDTRTAAEAAFGQNNAYLLIGNSLARLFDGLDLSALYQPEEAPQPFPALYSLITLFQFLEALSDAQANEATRVRVDWKYALHLPLAHPGVRAHALCDFRRRVFDSREGQLHLERLIANLRQVEGLPRERLTGLVARTLVETVCAQNRLELVARTMKMAVEAVAAEDGEWLRGILQPHWFHRYSREAPGVSALSGFGRIQLAEWIGEDGFYLMNKAAERGDLSQLKEIQNLKQVWASAFDVWDSRLAWKQTSCAWCLSSELGLSDLNQARRQ